MYMKLHKLMCNLNELFELMLGLKPNLMFVAGQFCHRLSLCIFLEYKNKLYIIIHLYHFTHFLVVNIVFSGYCPLEVSFLQYLLKRICCSHLSCSSTLTPKLFVEFARFILCPQTVISGSSIMLDICCL